MTDVANALEAVGALIAERTKYEGWVSALAKKSDVSPHVVDKVRSDYTARLRTVLQAFATHAPALDAALGGLQSRDASLAGQEQACRDEHAEGELRHMVGEFDSDQWNQVRIGHESLLGRLAQERQVIAAELANVKNSLAATADAVQRIKTLGDTGPQQTVTPPAAAAVSAPSPVSRNETPVARPVSVPAAVPVESPAAAPLRTAGADDLGFLRGPSPTPPREASGSAAGSDGGRGGSDTPTLKIVSNEPVATLAATPAGSPTSADAAKTLRCSECGTMNYATEWYCERCGGELAVL
jgi:hypothetical protein